eukprot:TRINITY_DN6681_c0_g1_i1.p1 TRINITY_DN6681_c0_g1~~TRINITY_DN6681_c0_g1_i1.p1  ORF type:complete len:625 (+),score=165.73 TRINITY_DN6681_c0_g1_i1:161-1876(+)
MPVSALPEATKTSTQRVLAVGSVGALVGVAAVQAGAVGRTGVLANLDCAVDEVDLQEGKPIDWEYHPARIGIGSHAPTQYYMGAVVCNAAIVTACLLGLLGLSWLLAKWTRGPVAEMQGNLRTPGLVFVPCYVLFQGFSLSAAHLVYSGSAVGAVNCLVGWLGLALSLGLPVLLHNRVLRQDRFAAYRVADPKLADDAATPLTGLRRKLYIGLYGRRVWSSVGDTVFVQRFGVVFESCRQRTHKFVLVDCVHVLLLSAFAAWRPRSVAECHARTAFIFVQLVVHAILVIRLLPYVSVVDNTVAGANSVIVSVAILLFGVAMYLHTENSARQPLFDIAGWLLLISAILCAAKGMLDFVLYCVDIQVGRKTAAWEMAKVAAAESHEMLPVQKRGGQARPSRRARFAQGLSAISDDGESGLDSVEQDTSLLSAEFRPLTLPSESMGPAESPPSKMHQSVRRAGTLRLDARPLAEALRKKSVWVLDSDSSRHGTGPSPDGIDTPKISRARSLQVTRDPPVSPLVPSARRHRLVAPSIISATGPSDTIGRLAFPSALSTMSDVSRTCSATRDTVTL